MDIYYIALSILAFILGLFENYKFCLLVILQFSKVVVYVNSSIYFYDAALPDKIGQHPADISIGQSRGIGYFFGAHRFSVYQGVVSPFQPGNVLIYAAELIHIIRCQGREGRSICLIKGDISSIE